MFDGRSIIIATKHKKEKVIAPVLEKHLGTMCFVTSELDTDKFGTFSSETERKDDPLTTARKKCLLAMEITDCDLAIASEGSFGPHPTIHFIPADDEILLLVDKKNDFEIMVRELSTDTNFKGEEIFSEEDLLAFADKIKFPSHALIIKNAKENFTEIVKGIANFNHLKSTYKYFMSSYGKAYLETDMRAMNNPTRMSVIAKATKKLVEKINSRCPHCDTPGFGITESKPGLPCNTCHWPTQAVLAFIYTCERCAFKKEIKYPNGKFTEDPAYCDLCNP